MTRWGPALVIVALLVVALLGAASFVVKWRVSSNAFPREDEGAAGEPESRSEEPGPERRRPRQRSTEVDPYADFRRYVDDRRAAGKPTTLRELLGPDPPDAENAAVEIKAALEALIAELGEQDTWPKAGPWGDVPIEEQTTEQMEELREFVKRFGPFLDRVAAALDRSRCRLPLLDAPLGSGPGVKLMRHTAGVLSAVATADADAGRRIDAMRTLLRLGRKDEPVAALHTMVDIATAMGAVTALRAAFERNEVDAARTRAALDDLLSRTWVPNGTRFAEMSVIETASMLQRWIDGDLGADPPKWIGNTPPPPADELVAGLELLEDGARVPTSSFVDYRRATTDVWQRAKAAGGTSKNLCVMLDKLADTLGRCDAMSRLGRIALAAAEYRATHGDFPASLDELKPMFADGVPLDPFTDAPFVYERTATGVRIASRGRIADEPPPDDELLRERRLVWELKK